MLTLTALVLGLAAPAADGEAALAAALNGATPAGPPRRCIQLPDVSSTVIVPGTAILYTVGDIVYVNRPEGGAEFLRDDDILVARSLNTQLCRPETVNLVDRPSQVQHGAVRLGQFVPYRRAAAVR